MARAFGAALIGCLLAAAANGAVEIEVDADRPGRAVNRLVLGSNVQWVDHGDGLQAPDGAGFDPARLQLARQMAPTSLRYPGGTQADFYRWQAGVGPRAQRGAGLHAFAKTAQPVLFGTDEFLQLCRELGAEPIITVNMVTGDAGEAAAWLAHVPSVRYWELGNEPYLIEDGHRHLALKPEEYARRVNRVAAALRAGDPAVRIGVALRSDRLGGVPATPFPGFNEKVTASLQAAPDFVAVHNAYAPVLMGKSHTASALHLALMAAPDQVAEDLDATQATLRRRWPDRRIPLALTEYAAYFGLKAPDDRRTVSLAAALYTADLLRVLVERDDVLMAHHWSLIGNWLFGAIGQHGERRPVYEAFATYGRLLTGRLLPARLDGPSLRTEQVGMIAPRSIAAVTILAVRRADAVVMFLVNRHPGSAQPVHIRLGGTSAIRPATATRLAAPEPFSPSVEWSPWPVTTAGSQITATLSPHSLTVIEVETSIIDP